MTAETRLRRPSLLAALGLFTVAGLATPALAAREPVTLVAVQYPIEGNQSGEAIAKKVERYVEEAKQAGADVVVLPELLTFDGWPIGKGVSDADVTRFIARSITPGYFLAIQKMAKAYDVMLVGGSSPRLHGTHGDGVRNTAIVAFPDGRVVYQDKVHLTAWEAESGMSPGDEIEVFDTPWGRAVVLICYDVEFPTLSSALIGARPLWWFVPSMTDTVHGLERVRWSAQARAVEHHAYVVVTGTVGTPSKDFPNVGQAAFLTPRREAIKVEVVEGERDRAGTVKAVLDVGALKDSRAHAKLYPAKNAAARQTVPKVRLPSP